MLNQRNNSHKIGIFYDGNLLLHISNFYNYVHPQKRRLSLSGLHTFIHHRLAEEQDLELDQYYITQAHYFRGRLGASDAAQRGNQLYNDRVFDDILMSEGIHPHYLPLRNVQGRKEERGIDVWLALEAYEMALQGKIDALVLIASDTDYAPLLRKVTKTSHELLSLATYPVAMQEVIECGLEQGNPLIMGLFVPGENSTSETEQQPLFSQPGCVG